MKRHDILPHIPASVPALPVCAGTVAGVFWCVALDGYANLAVAGCVFALAVAVWFLHRPRTSAFIAFVALGMAAAFVRVPMPLASGYADARGVLTGKIAKADLNAADNFIIEDGSVNTDIRNTTTVNFMVQPFLKVEIVGEPVVSGGVVTAQVLVTRATSKEEFKAKVEPMGGWNDNFTNVTDVRLFVGYSSTVDSNNQYSSWSNVIDYGGDQFEKSIGTPITISSRGTLKAGRKLFIRAAARINYSTAGERRYNFSEVREINVPEAE